MAANGFERLFEMQKNQYTPGSPVILQAGVLLKNTQNGRLVIQMKFLSVSEKNIAAVVVALRLMDVTGRELLKKEYQYLDLNVVEGETFGDRVPVFLSQNETRSYTAVVEKVVFGDGSAWEKPAEMQQLPLPEPENMRIAHDLQQQYRLRTMKNERLFYQLKIQDGLWQCGCGMWNRMGKATCHACHAFLEKQQQMADEALLQQQLDAHLQEVAEKQQLAELKREKEEKEKQEAEKQQAAMQAEKKAKGKKNLVIAAAAIALLAVIAVVFATVIIPNGHVRRGDEAFARKEYALALEEYIAAGEGAYKQKNAAAMALGDERMQAFDYQGAVAAYGQALDRNEEENEKMEKAKVLKAAQRSGKLYTTDDAENPLPANVYRYSGRSDDSGVALTSNGLIKFGENGWTRNISDDQVFYDKNLHLISQKDEGLDFLYLINPENGEYVCMSDVEQVFSISEAGVLYKARNGLYGLYDLQGNMLIEPRYTKVMRFSDGLAAVQKDGIWGYINEKGEEIIPLQYVKAESFVNGYAKVYLNARKEKSGDYYVDRPAGWGLIDTEGNVVVSIEYASLQATEHEMENGVIRVMKDDLWALYSLEKNKVCSVWYDELGEFSEGLAYGWSLMAGEDYYPCTRAEYIDANGKVQLDLRSLQEIGTGAREDCGKFINGFAVISLWKNVKYVQNGYFPYYSSDGIYYAVIDKTGRLVLPVTKDYLSRRDNGDVYCYDRSTTYSTENGQFGIIRRTADNTNTVSTAFMRQWGYVYPFSEEGIARVALNKGSIGGGAAPFGYITKDEKVLVDPVYQTARDFRYGYAAVNLDGKWGYIDVNGAYVIEPQYNDATGLLDENKTALVQEKEGGTYQLIDMTGKVIRSGIRLEYSYAPTDANGLIQENSGNKLRMFDTQGNQVF